MHSPKKSIAISAALLTIFTVSTAYVGAAPEGNQIGAQSEQFFQRETRPPERRPGVPPKPTAEDEEKAASPEALKEFFVKEIRVEGATVIPVSQLRPFAAKYENQMVNLVKLRAAARDITQYYRLKGFVTSRAFIPPQKIENQVVVIRVLEGKLGKATVMGNVFFSSDRILQYLTMAPGEVLKFVKLQGDMLRLNRNPDREVRAVLIPGGIPETTDVVLTVKDKFPVHVAHVFDNHGTRLSGRLRQGVQLRHNNLLGFDDQLFSTTLISEHGDFVGEGFSYALPLSPVGGRLIVSYSYTDVELGKELRPLDVKGGGNIWSMDYLHPIVDNANWTLDMEAGFDFKELWSTVNGQDNSRDHLRVAHFGPNMMVRDAWGSTSFKNDFVFGIPSFLGGNVKVDSRSNTPGAGGQFFKNELEVDRVQSFFWESVIIARFQAQLTQYRLVSAEQFAMGGYDTVRGYGQLDSLGDYGFLQSTEWRIPPYFIPKDFKIPGTKRNFWETVQFLAFADLAKTYLRGAVPPQDASKWLIGVGGGMRINFMDKISAQLDWGIPIGDTPEDGRETRLHFSLTTELPDLDRLFSPRNAPKP